MTIEETLASPGGREDVADGHDPQLIRGVGLAGATSRGKSS